jgi:chemotaxis protein CheX
METKSSAVGQSVSVEQWGELLERAAGEVFQMMLACDLQPVTAKATKPPEVTAVIGLAGQLCGVFTVRCSSRAAVLMTAAMLAIEPDEVDQQTWDGVGEICNMLAGNFKAKLPGIGDRCMLSVPTVVCGADYIVRSLADGARIERNFLFKEEPLRISLDVEKID